MEYTGINVLVSTFSGIAQSRTINFVFPGSTSIEHVLTSICGTLPPVNSRLVFTTHLNKIIRPHSDPLFTLLPLRRGDFIQLRLSTGLHGGKGGFGSQLRAAGGRMSSKRKKAQGENNGSNRNLDGRRIRTVNEAKALAEYLALKPDMDKKEKEEKRQRWQQVIDLTEKREEELRNGSRGKIDGGWVEQKEEGEEKTRSAVKHAMESGLYQNRLKEALGDLEDAASTRGNNQKCVGLPERKHEDRTLTAPPENLRVYAGFDNEDEDEFMSDTDDESHAGHSSEREPIK